LRVHALHWSDPRLQLASLDHALWFHRPCDFTQWHLFSQDAPSTSQGRGLVRGQVFARDGTLVASMAQECLMRIKA
jgi:acyl-CoA thioesterase-2